jgi:phage shock protein E
MTGSFYHGSSLRETKILLANPNKLRRVPALDLAIQWSSISRRTFVAGRYKIVEDIKNNIIKKLIKIDPQANRQIFPAASRIIHLEILKPRKNSMLSVWHACCNRKDQRDHSGGNMFFNSSRSWNIRPDELIKKINAGEDFLLLDVRTPQENAAQAIEGSYLIPLQELGQRMDELPKKKEIVVYCRVGNRSAYACSFLARMGYTVKNLEGGIMTWNFSENVSMTRAS